MGESQGVGGLWYRFMRTRELISSSRSVKPRLAKPRAGQIQFGSASTSQNLYPRPFARRSRCSASGNTLTLYTGHETVNTRQRGGSGNREHGTRDSEEPRFDAGSFLPRNYTKASHEPKATP